MSIQGTAFSIFSTDDEAHLLDLHLFLNRPFNIKDRSTIGIVPQDVLEDEHSMVMDWLANQHIVIDLPQHFSVMQINNKIYIFSLASIGLV